MTVSRPPPDDFFERLDWLFENAFGLVDHPKQYWLAEQLGVSESELSRWLRGGIKKPHPRNMRRVDVAVDLVLREGRFDRAALDAALAELEDADEPS